MRQRLTHYTMKMLERYTHVVPEAKRTAIHALSEIYNK